MTTEQTPPTLTIDGVAFVWNDSCRQFSAGCMNVHPVATINHGMYWQANALGVVHAQQMCHRSPGDAVADLRAAMHRRIESDRADAESATARANALETALGVFPC